MSHPRPRVQTTGTETGLLLALHPPQPGRLTRKQNRKQAWAHWLRPYVHPPLHFSKPCSCSQRLRSSIL